MPTFWWYIVGGMICTQYFTKTTCTSHVIVHVEIASLLLLDLGLGAWGIHYYLYTVMLFGAPWKHLDEKGYKDLEYITSLSTYREAHLENIVV